MSKLSQWIKRAPAVATANAPNAPADLDQLKQRLALLKDREAEKWKIRRQAQVNFAIADESWLDATREVRKIELALECRLVS